ncbi:MAG: bifunctional phosphoglucose/phosphomannose isomerase [Candidatus Margulisbacteria bacterium]|nr:bifunctional phosphoglucose/phosphomannose isomerase [Candidatus Margulisiibacteriota bacterium]
MVRLDEIEKFGSIDRSGMLESVCSIPKMLAEASELRPSGEVLLPDRTGQVVVSGIGGSAMGGDICRVLLEQSLDIPFMVNRSYSLPASVAEDSLVFIVSYSGETEETLNCFKEAVQRKAKVVCIASSGALLSLAAEKNIPFIKVRPGLQPRAAIAYLTLPILFVLEQLKLTNGFMSQVDETVSVLQSMDAKIGPPVKIFSNPAKQLAEKLYKKFPIILAGHELASAAGLRFKNQLNENSKTVAHLSLFTELDHNEIVGFSSLAKGKHPFALILLRDEKENERVKKRIDVTKSLISRHFDGALEVWSQGVAPLARLFSLIYITDMVSVYLAILKDIDPTPIDVIQKLKRELKR